LYRVGTAVVFEDGPGAAGVADRLEATQDVVAKRGSLAARVGAGKHLAHGVMRVSGSAPVRAGFAHDVAHPVDGVSGSEIAGVGDLRELVLRVIGHRGDGGRARASVGGLLRLDAPAQAIVVEVGGQAGGGDDRIDTAHRVVAVFPRV